MVVVKKAAALAGSGPLKQAKIKTDFQILSDSNRRAFNAFHYEVYRMDYQIS